jgi:hypothetical protein
MATHRNITWGEAVEAAKRAKKHANLLDDALKDAVDSIKHADLETRVRYIAALGVAAEAQSAVSRAFLDLFRTMKPAGDETGEPWMEPRPTLPAR